MLASWPFNRIKLGAPSSVHHLKFRLMDRLGFHYASLYHVAIVVVLLNLQLLGVVRAAASLE